jgi:hypothetical protein
VKLHFRSVLTAMACGLVLVVREASSMAGQHEACPSPRAVQTSVVKKSAANSARTWRARTCATSSVAHDSVEFGAP